MGAEPFDPFVGGDHRHAMVRGGRDDLLAQQCASAALDHPELAVDLVGTVEIDVEGGDVVQLVDRDSEAAASGWFRRWWRPP